MSLLVILLPVPPLADAVAPPGPAPLDWLLSPDGLTLARRGRDLASACPRADSVVAVAPAQALSWHRPVLPKAPTNRLRAALGGVLEEQLLAEEHEVHLALAPQPVVGTPTWVVALDKPWLQGQLDALAAAGLVVDRLVPAWAPLLSQGGEAAAPIGHFSPAAAALAAAASDHAEHSTDLLLALADGEGALCLPVAGSLAQALQPAWLARGTVWSATPAAAAAAERWLSAPVAVRSDADMALAAVRSPWNLLQFDLTPRRRGSLAAGKLLRQLASPAWAAARWGLAALLLVQVLGLNAMAWQQQRELNAQRGNMDRLLRGSHPQVRVVLDAPLQMQRETAALRAAAGVPGDEDFETLLAAAATGWPEGQTSVAQLRFETGRLSLPAAGWAPPQIERLRQNLAGLGFMLELVDNRLVIRRAMPTVRSQEIVAWPLFLTPSGGGLGAAQPWGRSQENVAWPLFLTPSGGGLGAARPWGLS